MKTEKETEALTVAVKVKEKAKAKAKDKDRAKVKVKVRVRVRVKEKDKAKAKVKDKDKAKVKAKVKGKDRGRAKVKAKVRARVKTKAKVRDKTKDRMANRVRMVKDLSLVKRVSKAKITKEKVNPTNKITDKANSRTEMSRAVSKPTKQELIKMETTKTAKTNSNKARPRITIRVSKVLSPTNSRINSWRTKTRMVKTTMTVMGFPTI